MTMAVTVRGSPHHKAVELSLVGGLWLRAWGEHPRSATGAADR
jgi:hypothetical protein